MNPKADRLIRATRSLESLIGDAVEVMQKLVSATVAVALAGAFPRASRPQSPGLGFRGVYARTSRCTGIIRFARLHPEDSCLESTPPSGEYFAIEIEWNLEPAGREGSSSGDDRILLLPRTIRSGVTAFGLEPVTGIV
jgi:hypothetical protein